MDDHKVAILLEDLMSKFNTFGEGLDGLRDEMNKRLDQTNSHLNRIEQKLDAHIEQNRLDINQNRQEHQQLMQMVKELDNEVQVEIKRVK